VVPRISSFYGIVITMYYGDHAPPHFHARHGDDEAKIGISAGRVLAGSLSRRSLRLVREWLIQHRAEVEANWNRVVENEKPHKIEPLP
jgi:RNase P protein component